MSRDMRGGRRDLGVAAALLALSLIFVSPIFRHLTNLGVLDWDANFYMHEVPRRTILEHGEFPLWNPYEWGGIPMLASPWSRFLSPTFAVILAFGTVVGSKLDVWVHLAAGLLGAYFLAKDHRMGRVAAFIVACAYFFGGWFSTTFASGMSVFLGTAFVPWALLAHRQARKDLRFAAALGAIGALILFDGAPEPLVMLVLALAVRDGVDLASRRTIPRVALTVALVAGFTFIGLSAIKLLPTLELVSQRQRSPRLVGGYSVESIARALFERVQTLRTEFPSGEGFWRGASWGIDETGAYVGVGVIALAAFGMRASWLREPAVMVSLGFFVWTAFGKRAPLGPWTVLHAVPPFSLMRVPERLRFVFMLDLALLAGCGLEALRAVLARRIFRGDRAADRARLATMVVAGAMAIDLVSTNGIAFRDAFPVPPVVYPKSDRFFQVRKLPSYDERGFLPEGVEPLPLAPASSLYPAVVAGIGTARGFEPLSRRALVVRARGESGYEGEEKLDGATGSVSLTHWTPNSLAFDIQADRDGLLVVNQAFRSGWRAADGRRPFSKDGLLALPIRAPRDRVELFFRPTSFVAGAILSLVTVLVVGGWLWGRHSPSARVSTD